MLIESQHIALLLDIFIVGDVLRINYSSNKEVWRDVVTFRQTISIWQMFIFTFVLGLPVVQEIDIELNDILCICKLLINGVCPNFIPRSIVFTISYIVNITIDN